MEVNMGKIFIEQKDDGRYKALKNKQVIATGNTQASTIEKVHRTNPDDSIEAERVKHTNKGKPDQWRHVYKGSK
jgi:hypothetical protein